jgi:hypothetical protein
LATRLYFRSASSTVSNLPTAEQSTLTAALTSDAVTVNRTLSENIGTSQSTLAINTAASASEQILYFSRFVSPALNMASMPAQTWTYNFAAIQSNTFANFPVAGSNQPIYICCYIWRPGTGKLGNILDGNSASVYDEPSNNAERVMHGTFSGSAVNSMQNGDVLCFEVWVRVTHANGNGRVCTFCYDGTTENTTENASVTNHASYLESPQNFTYQVLPQDTTPNAIVKVHPKPIRVV